MEKFAVSRLTGAPPGYVGYEVPAFRLSMDPWTNGSSGLVVDPYDRKVASSLSLFDADPTVCCCSMRWSNLIGRELEKRQNTQICGGRCMEYQYCIY